MSKHLDQIRSEGYVAGEYGAPREHNPHSHGSAEWKCWEDGWLEAQADFLKSYSANGTLAEFITWMIILTLASGFILAIVKLMNWIFSFV